MTPKQKGLLLKFITGSDNLPFNGFAGLKYEKIRVSMVNSGTIVADETVIRLPTSSTCSNLLRVPQYKTYDQLKSSLIFAIENSDSLDYEPGLEAGDEIVLNQRVRPASVNKVNHYLFESESEVSDLEDEPSVHEPESEIKVTTYRRMFKTF